MELTSHGNNAAIQIHPLAEKEMRRLGFTDRVKDRWYRCHCFRKNDCEISFNITIKKDGSDWMIDVLDDDYLQPYDYQYILNKYPDLQFALEVKSFVEGLMLKYRDAGLISGWKVGDYV